MRTRALFAGAVGALLLAIANPVGAKVAIAEAHIRGPGLGEGGLRISGAATNGMWESGMRELLRSLQPLVPQVPRAANEPGRGKATPAESWLTQ